MEYTLKNDEAVSLLKAAATGKIKLYHHDRFANPIDGGYQNVSAKFHLPHKGGTKMYKFLFYLNKGRISCLLNCSTPKDKAWSNQLSPAHEREKNPWELLPKKYRILLNSILNEDPTDRIDIDCVWHVTINGVIVNIQHDVGHIYEVIDGQRVKLSCPAPNRFYEQSEARAAAEEFKKYWKAAKEIKAKKRKKK